VGGRRDPQNLSLRNVVTYGPGGRFCMTDRVGGSLRQSRDALQVGQAG
jgi:carotenoid 1,2-hydratase